MLDRDDGATSVGSSSSDPGEEGASSSEPPAQLELLLAVLGCSLLADGGDLELKKLLIRRFCERHGAAEKSLVEQLVGGGYLPADASESWATVIDVEALLAAARSAARSRPVRGGAEKEGTAQYRQRPKFREQEEEGGWRAGQWMARWIDDYWGRWGSPASAPDAQGRVDDSRLEGSHLLSRLRHTREGRSARSSVRSASVGSRENFRDEIDRAARRDPTLTAVDFSREPYLRDFAALSAEHKAQAVRTLAAAARHGVLEEVRLDGLGLEGASCADALGELVRAPALRLLSLTRNRLGEAAVLRIAAALQGHEGLAELSIGEQGGGRLSTPSLKALLDAMEGVACPR